MRIIGIIAEYNPFHNGHKYHLDMIKEKTSADYVVVVMSGAFMQRGAPALIHKYARAEMALQNGADLVLELPFCFACGSAEYFANGAVSLLDKLGVIDVLGFGSECGDADRLTQLASILNDEPEAYRLKLQACLREGMSFPSAREKALTSVLPDDVSITGENIFSSPNNILGIEYCRALLKRNSLIRPLSIRREGAGYAEAALRGQGQGFAKSSALAIRTYLAAGHRPDELKGQMPDSVFSILNREYGRTFPIYEDDFSLPLIYKLLLEENRGYTRFADVSPELSRRIRNRLPDYSSFSQFCGLLKTKDVTYTRISRCLCHILLDLTQEDLSEAAGIDYVPYARILGLRKSSAGLFGALKQNSSIPLLSRLPEAVNLLSARAYHMLEADIRAGQVYDAAAALKFGGSIIRELSHPICVL